MNYRVLHLADLERFLELRMEFLLSYQDVPEDFQNITENYLRNRMETEDLLLLAAEEEGSLVAACMVCFYETCPMVDNPSGKYGELRNVYTKPAYRKKGISEKLVGMALEKAKERGVAKMRLHYTDDGLPCIRNLVLYQKKDIWKKIYDRFSIIRKKERI